MKAIAAVCLFLCLASCNSSLTTKTNNASRGLDPYLGIPYSMPRANYVVSVERELKSCDGVTPQYEMRVTIKEVMVKDTSNVYYIDYRTMKSGVKTVDFNVTFYPSTGGIKQIGAGIKDHTKDVVTGVVKAGIAVAGVATGNPLLAAAALASDPQPETSDDRQELSKVEQFAGAAGPTARTGGRSFRGRAAADDGCPCSQKAVDALDTLKGLRAQRKKTAHDVKLGEKETATALAKLDAKIADVKAFLVRKQDYAVTEQTVIPDGKIHFKDGEWPMKDKDYKAWFKPDSDVIIEWFKPAYRPRAYFGMIVAWGLSVKDTGMPVAGSKDCLPGKDEGTNGIVYRDPVQGLFTARSLGNETLLAAAVSVPQAGQCFVIPYSNKSFEDNAIQVTFQESGNLDSVTFKDKASRAKGATAAAQESLAAAAKAQSAARDATLQEYQRLKEELELKTAIIKQMKEYKAAVEQN